MKFLRDLFISDFFILSIIVLNAISLFFLGYQISETWRHTLEWVDFGCTLIFLFEAIFKINAWTAKSYFSDNWNRFDFILVAISIPHIFSALFGVDLHELGYLMIFRLFRIFRLIRLIKFVPNIDKIITGAMRAVRASSLIIFVFLLVNFIFGIIAHQIFSGVLPEHFEDPLLSMYSIFKIFTVEGWYEIPDEIATLTTPFIGMASRLFFISILFIGGIFGLSLVNSIFVDNMVADNNEDLEQKIDELKSMIQELKNRR